MSQQTDPTALPEQVHDPRGIGGERGPVDRTGTGAGKGSAGPGRRPGPDQAGSPEAGRETGSARQGNRQAGGPGAGRGPGSARSGDGQGSGSGRPIGGPGGGRPQLSGPAWPIIRRLLRYMRPHAGVLTGVVLAALATTAIELAPPWIIRLSVDRYILVETISPVPPVTAEEADLLAARAEEVI